MLATTGGFPSCYTSAVPSTPVPGTCTWSALSPYNPSISQLFHHRLFPGFPESRASCNPSFPATTSITILTCLFLITRLMQMVKIKLQAGMLGDLLQPVPVHSDRSSWYSEHKTWYSLLLISDETQRPDADSGAHASNFLENQKDYLTDPWLKASILQRAHKSKFYFHLGVGHTISFIKREFCWFPSASLQFPAFTRHRFTLHWTISNQFSQTYPKPYPVQVVKYIYSLIYLL